MTSPHPESFRDLLERRLSRRTIVRDAASLAVLAATPVRAWARSARRSDSRLLRPRVRTRSSFPQAIGPIVVLRWGDALLAGAESSTPRQRRGGSLLAAGSCGTRKRASSARTATASGS